MISKPLDSKPKNYVLWSFASIFFALCALYVSWYFYGKIGMTPMPTAFQWCRIILMAIMSIICLLSSVTFLLKKDTAYNILKLGLMMIPIMMFSNLVGIAFVAISNLLTGNPLNAIHSFATNPKNLIVPFIVLVIFTLSAIQKKRAE